MDAAVLGICGGSFYVTVGWVARLVCVAYSYHSLNSILCAEHFYYVFNTVIATSQSLHTGLSLTTIPEILPIVFYKTGVNVERCGTSLSEQHKVTSFG